MAKRVKPAPTVGAPTKYTDEMCDKLISLMAQGYSFTASAAEMGITRQTIWEWRKTNPEFSYAAAKGDVLRQFWWETKALTNASSGEGNAGMVQFGLKNISGEDWRDKQEIVQTSNVNVTIEDARKVIEAEIADILALPAPVASVH